MIQRSLNDRYELFQRRAQMLLEQQDMLSPPLFLHVFPEWLCSSFRTLIIGQETLAWGVNPRYHGSTGAPCVSCPYELLTTFKHWIQCPKAIEAMQHVYEIFDFAQTQPTNRRSPFWRAFYELMSQIEGEGTKRRALWSNLYRMDWSGGSVLKADLAVRQNISSTQRFLLRDEIAILKPGAVVFLTGPNYDDELKAEFENVQFQPIEAFRERDLARLTHPLLPLNAFRTYHPAYLQRSKRWHFLELIGHMIQAPGVP